MITGTGLSEVPERFLVALWLHYISGVVIGRSQNNAAQHQTLKMTMFRLDTPCFLHLNTCFNLFF